MQLNAYYLNILNKADREQYCCCKKALLIFGLLLSTTVSTFAQVNGIVISASDNVPVADASIVLKGKTLRTSTDDNGKFAINADKGDLLEVSRVGFIKTLFKIDTSKAVIISLEPSQKQLNEVVVTALGVSRKAKALGYAMQEVKGAALTEARETNLINSLSGRVAGVQITNGSTGVGSTSRIVIRGENSLSGSNQPLFVVDGTPVNNQTIYNESVNNASATGTWHEVDYGNGAGEINASDIESMSVLKGPAAAALYGSRASNGVIVITTRSGKQKNGRMGISFNSNTTMETPLRLPELQNQYGAGIRGEFAFFDGRGAGRGDEFGENWGPKLDGRLIAQFDSPVSTDAGLRGADIVPRAGATITPTPWIARPDNIKNFFETGLTFTNGLALETANEKSNFRFNFTNLKNTGIIPNTDLSRNTFTFKVGHQLSERITANISASCINSNSNNRPSNGYGSENPMYTFVWMGRQTNVESLQEYWQRGYEGRNYFGHNYAYFVNPYFILNENTNGFNKNRLIGNGSITYEITPKLKFLLRNGLDNYSDNRESRRAFSTDRFPVGGFRTDDVRFTEINTDVLLSYENKFGEFTYSASAGGNRMNQKISYSNNVANELIVPEIYNFSNARSFLKPYLRQQEKEIRSVYGFFNAGYKERIFLDITGRNDWSSTLPADNNSFFYPSVSLSGIVSEMVKLPAFISFAKLRASAAQVGSDTDPYNLQNVFLSNQPFGSTQLVTESGVLANANLKPESMTSYEFGADLRFLNGRIGIDATWYQNTNSDQIFSSPIPTSSGYTNRFLNGGKVQSQGIELLLTVNPLKTKDFRWDANFNFSRNTAIVQTLPEGLTTYTLGQSVVYSRNETAVYYNAVAGQKVGDMYATGFKKLNGKNVYKNGLPLADPSLVSLGNYNPDFMLGFFNRFTYKKLSMDVLFDWRKGGVFLSRTNNFGHRTGSLIGTLPGRDEGIIGDGVNEDGSPNTTRVAAQDYYQSYYNRSNEEGSVFDASYVKLREVKLGFNTTIPWMKGKTSDMKISLVGRNLFLWTENKHVDPETLSFRGGRVNSGVEDIAYPSTKSFGLSLNIGL